MMVRGQEDKYKIVINKVNKMVLKTIINSLIKLDKQLNKPKKYKSGPPDFIESE